MTFLKRVAIGMSGGVDSAVAALFLKQRGFQVHGVFMKNWDETDETGACTFQKDLDDASIVCEKLSIPLIKIDFVKQYWNDVFEHIVIEYQSGFTPNPDILCNRHIKFKYFYDYCINKMHMDAIATGHYANTSFGPFLENYQENEAVKLLQPLDNTKDQTFFLSQVDQEPLKRTMFPLANYRKTEVRQIAHNEGLTNVASKRDSTGICFIGKRQFKEFIAEYIASKPGDFINFDTGQIMGQHEGIHMYTLGQRTKICGLSDACFVSRKMNDLSTIIVAQGTKHPALLSKYVFLQSAHWIHEEPEILKENGVLSCYFQSQHILDYQSKCRIMKYFDNLVVILDVPCRALTPGQYGVFYLNKECLGGARITYVGPSQYFLNQNKLEQCLNTDKKID